jgi:hypothetical protein
MNPKPQPQRSISPVVAGLFGVAIIAIGAVVGFGLRAGTTQGVTPTELRAFLSEVSQAQTQHKTQSNTYAADLETLVKAGLRPAPVGITVDYRGSSPLGYCWVSRAIGVPVWFTVSQVGVAETDLPSSGPPPTICKAP